MRIATIKVKVPDEVKKDDVFNHLRGKAITQMEVVDLVDDPDNPPMIEYHRHFQVMFKARTEEDMTKTVEEIELAIQNVGGVIKAIQS